MTDRFSKARLTAMIREGWRTLSLACDAKGCDRWLEEAERIATRQERRHRAMGARFTRGQARYRVSCELAAQAIILGNVYRGMYAGETGRMVPETWADACTVRDDCRLAFAIRETVSADTLARLAPCGDIDYANDIAVNK